MIYIGIAGCMRSGKDTVAKLLMEELGKLNIISERRAFADSLKEEIAHFLHDHFEPKYSYEYYLAQMYADETKEQYRLLMKWWGTEGRRYLCDKEYWLKRLDSWAINSSAAVLTIPDVRFINEIDFIKQKKGLIVLVNRPLHWSSRIIRAFLTFLHIVIKDNHISENDFLNNKNWDYVIDNSKDIEYIREQVKQLVLLLCSSLTGDNKGIRCSLIDPQYGNMYLDYFSINHK